MKDTIIYCLEKDKKPFYIGRTSNLSTRIGQHKKTFGEFEYYELYRCTEKQAFWERHYIELFRSWGFELKNKSLSTKPYEKSDIKYKEHDDTTFVGVRINNEVLEFVKQQANKDGRTLSGMINKYLSDQKNRTENRERKEKE